jgi:hypothetical protein
MRFLVNVLLLGFPIAVTLSVLLALQRVRAEIGQPPLFKPQNPLSGGPNGITEEINCQQFADIQPPVGKGQKFTCRIPLSIYSGPAKRWLTPMPVNPNQWNWSGDNTGGLCMTVGISTLFLRSLPSPVSHSHSGQTTQQRNVRNQGDSPRLLRNLEISKGRRTKPRPRISQRQNRIIRPASPAGGPERGQSGCSVGLLGRRRQKRQKYKLGGAHRERSARECCHAHVYG